MSKVCFSDVQSLADLDSSRPRCHLGFVIRRQAAPLHAVGNVVLLYIHASSGVRAFSNVHTAVER